MRGTYFTKGKTRKYNKNNLLHNLGDELRIDVNFSIILSENLEKYFELENLSINSLGHITISLNYKNLLEREIDY